MHNSKLLGKQSIKILPVFVEVRKLLPLVWIACVTIQYLLDVVDIDRIAFEDCSQLSHQFLEAVDNRDFGHFLFHN